MARKGITPQLKASDMDGDSSSEDEDTIGSLFTEPDIFRSETFNFPLPSGVVVTLSGLKRETGQTLASTGLTVWRASDHLNAYIHSHLDKFRGKEVVELGSGLGYVSIPLERAAICRSVVATDGDDDTLALLAKNIAANDSQVAAAKLRWGRDNEAFATTHPHKVRPQPLIHCPRPNALSQFDIVLAADIIYREKQVAPLIDTVADLLRPDGEFLLAFARRNVPMDAVLAAAESAGLQHEVLEAGIDGAEPLYSFRWARE